MFELIALALIGWVIYAFATGKFKKEYRDKLKAELKGNENDLNQSDTLIDKEINALKSFSSGNKKLEIHYEDFEGNFTVREIEVQNIYKEGRYWYVAAYCFSAQNERTFRVDRISYLNNKKRKISLDGRKEITEYLKKNF